ncbi:hypothetical protein [Deinococcus humi]|uniref:Uncharacterized protein n=1 Tax=Deinococcus humi TaxID=662880 RepID=A0A7W8NEW3_9DEIO|nr:hypothetical protein [Deinococcus humi]MBB5361382.1 hypothetical protein [Deinococcus humi]GGO19796.1 hypothetical protein GCM10008949_04450 [Deinococcus humi]
MSESAPRLFGSQEKPSRAGEGKEVQMKDLSITLPDGGQVRKTADGRMSVYDLLKNCGAVNPRVTFKRLSAEYPEVVTGCYNLKFPGSGQRATPTADEAGWRQIKMVLPGVIGASYRAAVSDLIEKALSGDIATAAAIAERNNDARDLEWLGARALSKSTVLDLNGAISAAGCGQRTYAKVHDSNNVNVTGLTAGEIQAERGVKQTRDGLDVVELGLMIALQGTQTRQIKDSGARGDGQVLSIVHTSGAHIANLRRVLVGPRPYPNNGLLTVDV